MKTVLISYNHPTNDDSLRGAAVVFENGLILTQGTILVPLLHIPSQRKWLKTFISSLDGEIKTSQLLSNNVKLRVHVDEGDGVKPMSGPIAIRGVWKCPLIAASVKKLFYDWSMGEVSRGKTSNVDGDSASELMSVFLILAPPDVPEATIQCPGPMYRLTAEPIRGQDVLIESTPFGSELFMNSLSRGIVSNVLGSEHCLFMTDARTVPGCEGGPIFSLDNFSKNTIRKEKLIGLVSCSLTRWRGEWVGLTIGVALAPVLRRLVSASPPGCGHPSLHLENARSHNSVQRIVDETVVLVRCGMTWGSGVIVDAAKGIILTCSHCIKQGDNKEKDVFVHHKGGSYPVDVVFRSQDNVAYDLAALKLREPHPFSEQLDMADGTPQKGEPVLAAGYPLISEWEDKGILPTLVQGCVARVVPSMFQTTCCIQSGASGGAVLRGDKLLGIVVCVASHSSSGALFPHINFAIPVSCFRDPVNKYIETGDVKHLQSLEVMDIAVQTVWQLQSAKL